MNTFLPLVGVLQNSGAVINVAGPVKGPVGPVIRDPTTPTGHNFAQAFSQVFREQEESAAFSNQTLHGPLPSPQPNTVLPATLPHQLTGSPKLWDGLVASKRALNESPVYASQPNPEGPVPIAPVVESLSDSVTLLSPQKRASFSPRQDEPHVVNRDQGAPHSQPSSARGSTTIHLPLFEGSAPAISAVFQESGIFATAVDAPWGQVNQDLMQEQNPIAATQGPLLKVPEAGGRLPVPFTQVPAGGGVPPQASQGQGNQDLIQEQNPIAATQGPLLKVPEAGGRLPVPFTQVPAGGGVPPQASQGQVELTPSVVLNKEEERSTPVVGTTEKNVLGGLDPVVRSVNQDGTLPNPKLQRPSFDLSPPWQGGMFHRAPFVTALQPEGPVGFTEQTSINSSPIKPIPGITAVVADVPNSISEHRTGASVELLVESEWLGKGERPHTMVESMVKNVGVDPSGGSGLGAGMQQFSQSQSGFQQPSSFPGQGMGARALEERVPEFPTPVLQRLQMDIQLSENTRVQINVGVHQRQVYAGLVMDHSVLRNLATQFVPQLEQQLADVDMELREFSAEVREGRDQQSEALFHDSRSHGQQDRESGRQGGIRSTPPPLNRHEEQGIYFVA